MRCAKCQYESELKLVRCPKCRGIFAAPHLEELEHLDYLSGRLKTWRAVGKLAEETSEALLHQIEGEAALLRAVLGVEPRPVKVIPEERDLPPIERPSLSDSVPAAPPEQRLEVDRGAGAAYSEPTADSLLPGPAMPAEFDTAGQGFSWREIGTYLLSERTLHALLALGTFLILAAGAVISTVNPTQLDPLPHLAVVILTTVVFYVVGAFVQAKLRLRTSGETLLAIGGAFVPLSVSTLGGPELLSWDPSAIWLAASLFALPVYLASHAALRDRSFAVLAAIAGGGELLAIWQWLGLPLELGLCVLVGLMIGYARLAVRLRVGWAQLSWALLWIAELAVPFVLALLLVVKLVPAIWLPIGGGAPGALFDHAIAISWWLGFYYYLMAGRLWHRPRHRFLAAWTLPVAYLLTLNRMPLDVAWYNLAFGLLAAGYLIFARFGVKLKLRRDAVPHDYAELARDPVCQVVLVLSVTAALWPPARPPGQTLTFALLTAVYGAAAVFFCRRLFAYIGVYCLPVALFFALGQMPLDASGRVLSWTLCSLLLLVAAELAVRRSGEAGRPLAETALGLGVWQSPFGGALFSAGYATGLFALGLASQEYWRAPVFGLVREVPVPALLAFLVLVVVGAGSAVTRRRSLFLHLAVWLFLVPFSPGADLVVLRVGLPVTEAGRAIFLLGLAVAYLALGYFSDRPHTHYSKAPYLAGYLLLPLAVLLSALDRRTNVLVIGVCLMAYFVSALVVHRERHHAFTWLVARLFPDANSVAHLAARAVFLYLGWWLLPLWVLLALSLVRPDADVSRAGLVLALLAPPYVLAGLRLRRFRAEYRWPCYLGGYVLCAVGPLLAAGEPSLRIVTLGLAIALYVASAAVFRRSAWLFPVALLGPVLLWLFLERLAVPTRYNGMALLLLSLGYLALGARLQSPTLRAVRMPVLQVGPYALPFFLTSYALGALGLALVSNEDRPSVVLGFLIAALGYAASARLFRQSVFGYPLAATLAAAYAVAVTLGPVDGRHYGLGLLPGIVALLVVAEALRRRCDGGPYSGRYPWAALRLESWAAPFYIAAYIGTVAVPVFARVESGALAIAFWGMAGVYGASAVLFRHPAWLYPTIGSALAAYLASAYAISPALSFSEVMAALAVPTCLLFGVAHCVAGRPARGAGVSLDPSVGAARIWQQPWAAPALACGLAALVISVAGSVLDPGRGLVVASVYALLFAILSFVWEGEAEVYASLCCGALAFQEAMALAVVPLLYQPQQWATLALGASLVALAIGFPTFRVLRLWRRPLDLGSLLAACVATLLAVGVATATANRTMLQPAAAGLAIAGLAFITQGFHRRERLLGYLGLALLELGYFNELLFYDVGQPQAFVLPVGLYLLGIAYWEWRRGTPGPIRGALQAAALSLMCAVSLVQAVGFLGDGHDRYVYDTFLLFESLAIFGLGAVLRWKKPFFVGAVVLVVDVFVLLADPLRAMNTWYLVALIGVVMIGLVVFIEGRRERIPLWMEGWRKQLEAWD